jgi:hypothetical protein
VSQCKTNFVALRAVTSAEVRARAPVVESLHPLWAPPAGGAPAKYGGEAAADAEGEGGAAAGGLRVVFDARCELPAGASLTFYPYKGAPEKLASYAGKGPWAPLVVPGGGARGARLHYAVALPPLPRGEAAPWGFRFRVLPIPGLSWAAEEAVSGGEPSMAWASYLLRFLLREAGAASAPLAAAVHHRDVAGALTSYLRTPQACVFSLPYFPLLRARPLLPFFTASHAHPTRPPAHPCARPTRAAPQRSASARCWRSC